MGEWTKGYLAQAWLPHQKIKFFSKKKYPHRDLRGVQWPHPENWLTDITKSNNNMSPGSLSGINTTEKFINKWTFECMTFPSTSNKLAFSPGFAIYKLH